MFCILILPPEWMINANFSLWLSRWMVERVKPKWIPITHILTELELRQATTIHLQSEQMCPWNESWVRLSHRSQQDLISNISDYLTNDLKRNRNSPRWTLKFDIGQTLTCRSRDHFIRFRPVLAEKQGLVHLQALALNQRGVPLGPSITPKIPLTKITFIAVKKISNYITINLL